MKRKALQAVAFICLMIGLEAGDAKAQCELWLAKITSLQGTVEVRRPGQIGWEAVHLDDLLCREDMLRVGANSRAAITLSNQAVVRLHPMTSLILRGSDRDGSFVLDLLRGITYIMSRFPRSQKIVTPFVNAAVEGTEFMVNSQENATWLTTFEGRVLAVNEQGSTAVASGQSAIAEQGKPPVAQVVIRPRDSVYWALYYPPIIAWVPRDFDAGAAGGWQQQMQGSLESYYKGDLSGAFSALGGVLSGVRDARFYNYRAALNLTVGQVAEAIEDTRQALAIDPQNGDAFSLQSVIATVQNEKENAYALATRAVDLAPVSPTPRVALSYAQQARFNLEAALASILEAIRLDPANSLAWARLAELRFSLGEMKGGIEAAHKAVALNPELAHAYTVLGFAALARVDLTEAKHAFEDAIRRDSAAFLPRLGFGLALIREGKLAEGRAAIETAGCLDPSNSLTRSYLGKAYYDEKRDAQAAAQYRIAKSLDPQDPTPYFYEAILKQTDNRPVEALADLQKSIELNNNRLVYRSQLLLDSDLAARSASLARIYGDLGFRQRALVEGFKSVTADPSNFSAHRFLSDSYRALPRHELARTSELLQSQMLQPLNITPLQPQLAEANLFILEEAGPSIASFNEFNPLFLRNRMALQADGVAGSKHTLGDEVIQSGLWDRMSYSLGQYHFETNGFRDNNDQKLDIYNGFFQTALTPFTSFQAEARYKDVNHGDLPLRFDPEDFLNSLRQKDTTRSIRFGARHSFGPDSDLLGTASYLDANYKSKFGFPGPDLDLSTDLTTDERGVHTEMQYFRRSSRANWVAGAGYFDGSRKDVETTSITIPFLPTETTRVKDNAHLQQSNMYGYSLINWPENVTWTFGLSADYFEGGIKDRNQLNPKAGILWSPLEGTTLRATVFRTLSRTLLASQTLEPTQVAGFNQFYDDPEGTSAWRYGAGLDQRLPFNLLAGVEASKRDLKVPFQDLLTQEAQEAKWDEYFLRGYLYWAPHPMVALRTEYQFERFERQDNAPGEEGLVKVNTHRFPLGASFFHPSGVTLNVRGTYVDQEGDFAATGKGNDSFWVFDASISYRLPERYGFVSFGVFNIFNEEFHYQDSDPKSPTFYPERCLLGRITLAF
jgi:tetratricopeptide (TPR) repeat protein